MSTVCSRKHGAGLRSCAEGFASLLLGLVAVLMIDFASPAFAGVLIGNGGDAVVCPGGRAPELLDLFEARRMHGALTLGQPGNPGAGKDAVGLVGEVLARARQRDHWLGSDLEKELAVFFSRVRFVDEAELGAVDDATPAVPLASCRLQQLAVHTFWDDGQPPTFRIDRALWSEMEPVQQAGLIVHELLYSIARRDRALMRSDDVRPLVGRLFAFPHELPREYPAWAAALRRVGHGFFAYSIPGLRAPFRVSLESPAPRFDSRGLPVEMRLVTDSWIRVRVETSPGTAQIRLNNTASRTRRLLFQQQKLSMQVFLQGTLTKAV